jgi:large subunit ribosomal protein L15
MQMDLSTLSDGGLRKRRKRVGRGPGSGHGKTCCRGHKGQRSRAGSSIREGFEGGQTPLARRLPKVGFNHEGRFPYAIVNLERIEKLFENGAVVTAEALVEVGLARTMKCGVKVLGTGGFTKKITLKVNAISESARKKVEAAGGTVELIEQKNASA